MQRICQQSYRAKYTYVPKRQRNYAAFLPFAMQPLYDKAHRKNYLTTKTYGQPNGINNCIMIDYHVCTPQFSCVELTTPHQINLPRQLLTFPNFHILIYRRCAADDLPAH